VENSHFMFAVCCTLLFSETLWHDKDSVVACWEITIVLTLKFSAINIHNKPTRHCWFAHLCRGCECLIVCIYKHDSRLKKLRFYEHNFFYIYFFLLNILWRICLCAGERGERENSKQARWHFLMEFYG
jgi:hypothetical protein